MERPGEASSRSILSPMYKGPADSGATKAQRPMPRYATVAEMRDARMSYQPLNLHRPDPDPEPWLPRNPVERRLARLVLQDILDHLARHSQHAA